MKMKKLMTLSCALLLSMTAYAPAELPTAAALEASFGKPVMSKEYKGVAFRVFSSSGLKIVAVNPPNSPYPAFLSFVRENGQLATAEINQFLSNFAATAGSPWKVFDREAPDRAIQFFMSAPYADPQAARAALSKLPDPSAASAAWEKLSRDPLARSEASQFLDMLRAQRQMWITEDGKYLATWSPDGSSLGVGVVPPAAR